MGVPLVDSLLDSSIAWQPGGGKQSWGDEYVSVRGRGDHPIFILPTSITSATGCLNQVQSAHFASDMAPSTALTRGSHSTSEDPSVEHLMVMGTIGKQALLSV